MLEDSEDEGGLKGFHYGSGIHRDRVRKKRDAAEEEATDSEEEGATAKAPGRRPKSGEGLIGNNYRSKVHYQPYYIVCLSKRCRTGNDALSRPFPPLKLPDPCLQKSGGDVQRKGQAHQPYAYVPFDKQHMNKR